MIILDSIPKNFGNKTLFETVTLPRNVDILKQDITELVKQNTSLKKSPTKVSRSQRNYFFASIIACCKLEFLRFKTSLNHFALKYRLTVRAINFHIKNYSKFAKTRNITYNIYLLTRELLCR